MLLLSNIQSPGVILGVVIVAWLAVIPLAGATISRAMTVERISDPIRAFIEIRWPNSLIHYLSSCTTCMSYWTTSACSAAAGWASGVQPSPIPVTVWILLTLASIRLANLFATHGESDD